MKTRTFIEKATSVHKGKYDYSKVDYINNETKVCIVCPEHGEFWQTPHNHLKGRGCPECKKIAISNARKLARKTPVPIKDERSKTEKFIDKAQKLHGGKYDYSKVEYVNSNTTVCIICPEHGEFWQTPHTHLTNKGCPKCGVKRQGRKTQSSFDFIQKAREVHGNKYDYSKVKYVNNYTKIDIICPIHGIFQQTPNGHLSGKGCIKCARSRLTATSQNFIEKAKCVHGNKYVYSKVKYIGCDKKVVIQCPMHGEFQQTPHIHLSGHGCPKCAQELNRIKNTNTVNDFVEASRKIHGNKYSYEKSVYVNSNTPLTIICPIHGEFLQKPSIHLQGCGCGFCAIEKLSHENTKEQSDFLRDCFKVHGDKYDYSQTKYVNAKTKVNIICPEHGIFQQTPNMHLYGQGCPKCQHLQSKPELEIIEYLKLYLKPEQIIERNRELLDGKEVDILLPDFHIGIEFNGLHWHSHKMKQDLHYHQNKMKLANSKGFRLIQIFEDEWIEHKDIVLNKLKHFIGGDNNYPCIGARKCKIGLISKENALKFLEQYHIQGYTPSTIYLGAHYNDELVGVMTFTEEQLKMWNLTRFATKTDYRLPGLANKMFKYFIKNYEYIEIKSFLDLRWNQSLNDNTVYDKLGFELVEMLAPDYRYIVGNERKHKFAFRKQRLHKKYGLPLTMTEKEMCDKLGFERIYDCGLAKYVYIK